MVAIKKITNAFEHHTFAKRTLREITLMRMMQHENVSATIAMLGGGPIGGAVRSPTPSAC